MNHGSEKTPFFSNLRCGTFRSRPNRFVVECEVEGEQVQVSLPNPGRLLELFFPGVRLLLAVPESGTAKLPYKVVGVLRDGVPIMLDTHKANVAVELFLQRRQFPGLEDAEMLRREVPWNRSRFDFLLSEGGSEVYLEVKSCTLFGGNIAMFPDAITARGRKHLLELAELVSEDRRAMVIFLAQWNRAKHFLPDYHTDLAFSRDLIEVRDSVDVRPYAIGWTDALAVDAPPRLLSIPWHVVEREAHDSGCYLTLLENDRDQTISIGKLGRKRFPTGYYLYVGSARRHLTSRIERHRRLRKNHHWHIDTLRAHTRFVQTFPIRTADDLECELAESVSKLCDWSVPGFGCSDCACDTHLFGFGSDPRMHRPFVNALLWYRMERLTRLI